MRMTAGTQALTHHLGLWMYTNKGNLFLHLEFAGLSHFVL